MKIKKDKNYFKIYLACVIIDGFLSICGLILLIISIVNMVNTQFNLALLLMMLSVLFFVALANTLSWRSLIGYLKTPDVVLSVEGDMIHLTHDRSRELKTIAIDSIMNVSLVRPMICRSGQRIVIEADQDYYLEDVENLEESFSMLKELINK